MARVKQSARKAVNGSRRSRGVVQVSPVVRPDKRRPSTGGIKRPHRYKPGTVALREIRRYQKSTELLLRKAPFARFCREVTQKVPRSMQYQFQSTTLLALQEAAECFLVHIFELTNYCAIHCQRVTITSKDLGLVLRFYNELSPGARNGNFYTLGAARPGQSSLGKTTRDGTMP